MLLSMIRSVVSVMAYLLIAGACAYGAPVSAPVYPGQAMTLLSNGEILVTGGIVSGRVVGDAFLVDVTGKAQKLQNSLEHPRAGHSATALPDGTVLIFGGTDGQGHYVRTMELYDPTTESFRSVQTPALMPRSGHTATLLTDGTLVVIGGTGEGGAFPDDIQFWNSRSGAITAVHVHPIVPRQGHTASLLPDGTVQIQGGTDANGKSGLQNEIFNPVSRTFQTVPASTGVAATQSQSFRIAASIPAEGDEGVPIDSYISIRFSGVTDVRTVDPQSIQLKDSSGNLVNATVAAAEEGRLAFLIPSAPLMPGAAYSVNLTGVHDSQSGVLPDTEIDFQTASDIDDGSADGWIPDPAALAGNWVTGTRTASASHWQNLPPLQARPGATAVSGQVLGLSGRPLPRVTLSIGSATAHSDGTGRFLMSNLAPGAQILTIDGRTANTRFATYGLYQVRVQVNPKTTNVLNYTIWMTRLDTAHAVRIPSPTTAADTVITTPLLPGLELHLPAHTTIVDYEGRPVTQLTITPIPLDKPPFPLPTGVHVPIYFTIQPGGSEIEVKSTGSGVRGARLFYPNTYNEPAGTQYNFWNYDPTSKGWYIYGSGRVSADKAHIVPDPGVVVYELTGAMVGGSGPKNDVGDWCPSSGVLKYLLCGGDPVDLASGEFMYAHTDLALPDVIPIALTRTYTTNDHYQRPFGVGATDNYDMFMVGDSSNYTYQELILPRGQAIRFNRISAGTGYADAYYSSTALSGEFYGATLAWNTDTIPGASWILRTRAGTLYGFPEAFGQNDQVHQALDGIMDRHGNLVRLTRDGNANLTKITSPSGRYIALTDDPQGRIVTATDNGGRTVSYTYDAGGRVATVTDVNNGVTTFAYNSNDQMTSITDPRNIEYLQNQYDGNGRVMLQTQADGSTYKFQWTPSGNATQRWVTSGPVDRYNPNDYEGYTGLISQVVVTDPRGYQRQVQFDNLGRITSDTRALGQPEQEAATTLYYADNLVKSTTDPLGRETDYDYDANGNPTSIKMLAGTANAVTYTATYDTTYGNLLTGTDPLGHTTTYKYDGVGDLVNVQDPLGHGSTIAYNDHGEIASVTDAVGNITKFGYSAGVLSSATDPYGSMTTFFPDQFGRTSSTTDANGNTTRYQYDNFNRVTNITNAQGAEAIFTYDPNGDPLSVEDFLSHTTHFTYDSMDRLSTRTDPLNRVSSVTYDLAGNPVSLTDRLNQVTSNTFDGLGRKVFTGFGATTGDSGPVYQSTISYQYDAGNRLTSATDSIAGMITMSYDGLNSIASESGRQGSISYGYDAAERRTSAQAGSQTAIQYAYDNANRLTGITQGTSVVSFVYDSANRRTTLTLPNGVTVQYGYDQDSRPQSLSYTAGSGSSIGNLTYGYDADGQRTEIGGSMAHTNFPNALTQATYDAANELTSWDGVVPTYDEDGEMTTDINGNQYTWNARNQLTAISGASSASFGYDAFGRRISKAVGAASVSFQYDGLNRVAETAGGATAWLLPGSLDVYFQRSDTTGTTVPLTDALGNTIGMTDETGSLATTYWYDPFGGTTVAGAANENSSQFAGRENDSSGLYYYRARYYNAQIERFISEDPIGLTGGMNEYRYVDDNPLNYIDPLGLDRTPPLGLLPGVLVPGRMAPGAYGPAQAMKALAEGRPATTPDPELTPGPAELDPDLVVDNDLAAAVKALGDLLNNLPKGPWSPPAFPVIFVNPCPVDPSYPFCGPPSA